MNVIHSFWGMGEGGGGGGLFCFKVAILLLVWFSILCLVNRAGFFFQFCELGGVASQLWLGVKQESRKVILHSR